MSSLFQHLVNKNTGRVFATTAAPDGTTVIFRGIAVRGDGAVHMSNTGPIAGHVGGVPILANGAIRIVDVDSTPDDTLPGALRTVTGRLYVSLIATPDVIHQGVGLVSNGRLCCEEIV